jgi:hypothetical protein
MESEQGVWNNLKRTYGLVMEDFIKLLDVRARIKLMVYRVPKRDFEEAFTVLQRGFAQVLRVHRWYDPAERWLFIGIPWYPAGWESCRNTQSAPKVPVALDELNIQLHILENVTGAGPVLARPPWLS